MYAIGVFLAKHCNKTGRVSRGTFARKMCDVCNHSVLICSLPMGFGQGNCVLAVRTAGKRWISGPNKPILRIF